MTFQEDFSYPIRKASAYVSASEHGWRLVFMLHGPDGRYNSRNITIFDDNADGIQRGFTYGPTISEFEKTIKNAYRKLKMLRSDPDMSSSNIDLDIDHNVHVKLNGPFGSGVFLGYHSLFSDEEDFTAFLAALDAARTRGSLLVQKSLLLMD